MRLPLTWRFVSFGNSLHDLIISMRPQQWTKNLIVYAALVFDGNMLDPYLFLLASMAALLFCLVSSSVYLLNDLVDMERDRQHPRKRYRPLASGRLSPHWAILAAILLSSLSLIGAFWLDPLVGVIIIFYIFQNLAYSFYLKNVVILDVMVLSAGFLLRIAAGAVAVDVTNFSPWLYICVALLALFLGFGKRRSELNLLDSSAATHRASLAHYNQPLIDQIMGIVTTGMVVAYTLYTFEANTALVGGARMLITVPFVVYFIFRYLYLIHVENKGGTPDELLIRDKPLLVNTLLWGATVVILIYADI